MNCIDFRLGSSRERIGLAAWRSSHNSVSVGLVERDSHDRSHPILGRVARLRAPRFPPFRHSSPSTSAKRAASVPAGTSLDAAAGRDDVEKCAVEQLARDGAGLTRAYRGGDGVVERRERAEHTARRAGDRRERQLDAREERQRPFAADEQIDQITRFGETRDAVSRRVLRHAAVDRWRGALGRRRVDRRWRRSARLPERPLGHGAPRRTSAREPSSNTQSSARTQRRIEPKCIECGPAAFVAVMPPIVQNAPLDGSTGNRRP